MSEMLKLSEILSNHDKYHQATMNTFKKKKKKKWKKKSQQRHRR